MTTAASGLKELHHIHIRLQDVEQKLEQGPNDCRPETHPRPEARRN